MPVEPQIRTFHYPALRTSKDPHLPCYGDVATLSTIKSWYEDNKNPHSALPNLELRLIPLLTNLSPTSAGNAAPPAPTISILLRNRKP